MKIAKTVSIVFISIFSLGSLFGADIAILIDASGSMKGFAQAGTIQMALSQFQEAIEDAGMTHRTLLFYSYKGKETIYGELKPGQALDAGMFTGTTTVLDTPLIEHSKKDYKGILFITDNVDNSTGAIDTQRFYSAIQNTEEMKQLNVIPLILKFAGRPYVSGIANYKGDRGMMAYLVAYKEVDDNFVRIENNIKEQGFDFLHFYPISGEHIKIDSNEHSGSEYVLKTLGAKYILSKNKKMQLARAIISGKESEIRFSFDLSSKYDHFFFKKDTKVKIHNLKISADGKNEYPIKVKYTISPNKLVSDMNPDGVKQSFTGVLRIKAEPSISQEIKMLIKRPQLQICFDILLEAQEGGLSLTPECQERYFSDDPLRLEKIYSKYDLLSFINPYSNKVKLSVQNLNNKKSPESTIAIQPEHESTIILSFAVFLIILIVVVYYLMNYFSVKSISVIEDEKSTTVAPHSSYVGQHFVFKNGNKRQLTITNSNWQLAGHSASKSTHVLLAGVFYELHDQDFSERISIHYKIL